jgi:hypothetical protein
MRPASLGRGVNHIHAEESGADVIPRLPGRQSAGPVFASVAGRISDEFRQPPHSPGRRDSPSRSTAALRHGHRRETQPGQLRAGGSMGGIVGFVGAEQVAGFVGSATSDAPQPQAAWGK